MAVCARTSASAIQCVPRMYQPSAGSLDRVIKPQRLPRRASTSHKALVLRQRPSTSEGLRLRVRVDWFFIKVRMNKAAIRRGPLTRYRRWLSPRLTIDTFSHTLSSAKAQ